MKSYLASTLACGALALAAQASELQPQSLGQAADPTRAAKLALEQNPALEYAPNLVLVKFADPAAAAERADVLDLVGGKSVREYQIVPGLHLVSVQGDVLGTAAVLSVMPGVEFAEPDFVVRHCVTPNDTYFSLQWGLHNTGQTVNGDPGIADADIDAPEAWDTLTGSSSFVVAVIDTGTQWSHPDLDGNIWSNPGEIAANGIDDDGNGYIDDTRGWDFYSVDNNPDDTNGHGTHTAGTVAAEGNNGIGVAGVCWTAKIMPLRFLGPQGGFTSDAVLAVQYCTNKGVKVSNNSWGGGSFSSSLYNAINASKSVGHIFVAAAGNNGTSQAIYPALYDLDNIISVAATDNNDGLASFSNYNSVSVDLGAPGVNIASTYTGGSYVYMNGTSMACPHVAGVAALVYMHNPGWTYSQVRSQILGTVRPVASLAGKTVTGGVVNAAAALGGEPPPPPPQPPAAPSGLTVTKLSSTTVRVAWIDNSNDEDSFEIERQRRQGGSWTGSTTFTLPANATQMDDTPGSSGTYRYRVRAKNTAGESAWTGWKQVKL